MAETREKKRQKKRAYDRTRREKKAELATGLERNSHRFSQRVADYIIEQTYGGRTFISIGADLGIAPGLISQWIHEKNDDTRPGFYEAMLTARKSRLTLVAEDILEIADNSKGDKTVKVINGKEVTIVNHENVNRDRLRIDSRKWLLAKLNAEQYGDNIKITHSGQVDMVAKLSAARNRAAELQAKMLEGTQEGIRRLEAQKTYDADAYEPIEQNSDEESDPT